MKVALVIGHKANRPGSCNKNYDTCEYSFNEGVVHHVKGLLEKQKDWDPIVVYRNTYKTLPDDINELDPDFIVSFHCNAFNGKASGSEVLYYYNSEKGKQMAQIMLNHIVNVLELPDRGIKGKGVEDRGGHLLRYTKAPCILIEPFFIDNDSDLERAKEMYEEFIKTIASAINEIKEKVF